MVTCQGEVPTHLRYCTHNIKLTLPPRRGSSTRPWVIAAVPYSVAVGRSVWANATERVPSRNVRCQRAQLKLWPEFNANLNSGPPG